MRTLRVTRNDARLIAPPPEPDGRTYRYGVAAPFQVAPGLAALSVAESRGGSPRVTVLVV